MTARHTPSCPPEMTALANAMADDVRPVIRRHFRTRLAVDAKDDASPVTIADREAEQVMRAAIMARFPAHGIRGEEFGQYQADNRIQFIDIAQRVHAQAVLGHARTVAEAGLAGVASSSVNSC